VLSDGNMQSLARSLPESFPAEHIIAMQISALHACKIDLALLLTLLS